MITFAFEYSIMVNREKTVRHILGYSFGFSVFAVLIPWCLINFSLGESTKLGIYLTSNETIRLIIGCPILLVGLIFAFWSNYYLLDVGKGGPADGFNVTISPRSEKLVVVGPYKYTRNPMVLGAFLVYFSIGIFYNSFSCLILLVIILLLMMLYLKRYEEKRLLKDFGDEFIEYKKKVPMLIPFLKFR